jgi:3-methyladenine DNA glycosylase AlkD
MASWGAVDMFGTLIAGQAWRRGQIPDAAIHEWARRADKWWRRAALVATVPLNVKNQGGHGDSERTLAVCRILVDDREDLVVKALSWALRELIPHDEPAVQTFLAEWRDRLAPRVRREVEHKLATGLKSGPKRSAHPAS